MPMPMPMMSSMGIRGTVESAKRLCHCLPVPTCAVMHTFVGAWRCRLALCPRRLPPNRHAAAIDDESRRIRRGDGRRRRTSIRVRHDRGRGGLALVDQVIREDRADLQDRALARGDHRGLVFEKPSVERKASIPRSAAISDAPARRSAMRRTCSGAVMRAWFVIFSFGVLQPLRVASRTTR